MESSLKLSRPLFLGCLLLVNIGEVQGALFVRELRLAVLIPVLQEILRLAELDSREVLIFAVIWPTYSSFPSFTTPLPFAGAPSTVRYCLISGRAKSWL